MTCLGTEDAPHTVKSSVGPTLKNTVMIVKKRMYERRKGLFLTGGLKEGCLEEVI